MKFKILLILLFISLLSSCSITTSPSSLTLAPPGYYLLDNADPEESNEYLARMEKYDSILATSPIPIFIIDIEDFASEIFLKIGNRYPLEKMSRINILGMYFYGNPLQNYPHEFIFINKSLTPEQMIVTYFHEIGHYYHRINKCQECIDNPINREKHALYNELKMGWEYDVPLVLESSIRTMALYATDEKANTSYKMATFEVMKTDLWKQTMAYLISLEKGLSL